MKYFLKIVIGSLISGIVTSIFSIILNLEQPFDYWFYFGSCSCFFSFGYAEGLSFFFNWYRKQPKFKGFKYWIKKVLSDIK